MVQSWFVTLHSFGRLSYAESVSYGLIVHSLLEVLKVISKGIDVPFEFLVGIIGVHSATGVLKVEFNVSSFCCEVTLLFIIIVECAFNIRTLPFHQPIYVSHRNYFQFLISTPSRSVTLVIKHVYDLFSRCVTHAR